MVRLLGAARAMGVDAFVAPTPPFARADTLLLADAVRLAEKHGRRGDTEVAP